MRLMGFTLKVGTWFLAPKQKVTYVPTFEDKEISIVGLNQTVIDTQPLQGSFDLRTMKGHTQTKHAFGSEVMHLLSHWVI